MGPCVRSDPDGTPNNGDEIVSRHGFIPARTLGLFGAYNTDQLLLVAWNNPIRYSVTAADNDAGGPDVAWDFTVAGEMNQVTMANLQPDLIVCDASPDAAGGSAVTAKCNAGEAITTNAPVVFDYGHPELKELLSNTIFLMAGCSNWDTFKKMLDQARPKYGGTIEMEFDG